MDEICQHLSALTQAVKSLQDGYVQLEEWVQSLATSTSPPAFPATAQAAPLPTMMMLPPEPRVPMSERFSGDLSKFRTFHNACQLYFDLQPRTFSLEGTKVGFIIALLQGEPQSRAHQLLERNDAQVQGIIFL